MPKARLHVPRTGATAPKLELTGRETSVRPNPPESTVIETAVETLMARWELERPGELADRVLTAEVTHG